jgi:hypothetical protein
MESKVTIIIFFQARIYSHLLILSLFLLVFRLKNYTGAVIFAFIIFTPPHFSLYIYIERGDCLLELSESGGNMQLLAIKTQHFLENANITKSMMF